MSRRDVSVTFSAKGDTSSFISCTHNNADHVLDISFSTDSDWSGMVMLQKTVDAGTTVNDVDWMTEDVEFSVKDHSEGVLYRLKCIYHESGQAEGRIYK